MSPAAGGIKQRSSATAALVVVAGKNLGSILDEDR
jgi:hypothetical protein